MTLLYFAWVRQKTGRGEEQLALPAGVKTVSDLIAVLTQRGGGFVDAFADPKRIRVAVNQEHTSFDAALKEGDEVAFFPPVTGG
ncbi:MAG: molybdopterin converting factor subunit 1 [Proteobacteria bacterium]|nr:molybdopterin converting factor subunit 1 [Pseudomonadota bacterium]